jgi:hypothetical protein
MLFKSDFFIHCHAVPKALPFKGWEILELGRMVFGVKNPTKQPPAFVPL